MARDETEQEILREAARLFRAKGYHGMAMSDLAIAVRKKTGSLYYYVDSKQALLLKVLEEGLSGFLSRLEEIAVEPHSARERLRLSVENHLDFIFERPDAIAVFIRERRFGDPDLFAAYNLRVDRYDALFSALVRDALGPMSPADSRVLSLAILSMLNGVIEWYREEGRLSRDEIRQEFASLILGRMVPPVDAVSDQHDGVPAQALVPMHRDG